VSRIYAGKGYGLDKNAKQLSFPLYALAIASHSGNPGKIGQIIRLDSSFQALEKLEQKRQI